MNWIDYLAFDKSRKAVKTFGVILAIILIAISIYQGAVKNGPFEWFLGMAVLIGFSAFFVPVLVRIIYYPWMIAARVIGFIVMHGLLAILFYGIITPLGWLRRTLFKNRVNEETYWIKKKNEPDMERMF